jgi:NTE family protein
VRAEGERALVLGGGGSAGNAWLIGVVAGLFDAGLDVTEEPVVFDRHSGVELVDAIATSCANGFGVPPYSIGDSRYIDGGYRRSSQNADLAAGYGRVLVLSPLGGRSRAPLEWGMHLAAQVDELRARGSRVETVLPDSDSRNAFGSNLMDLSTRPPAARAGYDQGRALAGQLTEFPPIGTGYCLSSAIASVMQNTQS